MIFTKWVSFATLFGLTYADYQSDRQSLIDDDFSQMLGFDVVLNKKEMAINNHLMQLKRAESAAGFDDPGKFMLSRNFLKGRLTIENSEVFKFIQKIPKGASLHVHATAMLSSEALFNMTFVPNLYACTVNGRIHLKFMASSQQDKTCSWQLLKDIRTSNATYDEWLQSQFTIQEPKTRSNDINEIWESFESLFASTTPMIRYRPFFREYVYKALEELYNDNVMYVEVRGSFSYLYELNGDRMTKSQSLQVFQDVVNKFKRDYPDFLGAKVIYSGHRLVTKEVVGNYINEVNQLKQDLPNLIVGFDLVGQEDKGKPILEFVDEIRNLSSGINIAFHAGETNWYGTSSDQNLFDAILLGSKRIGHGYAVTKHPTITRLIKEREIAIEVSPISNQVLGLVEDIRNHPAAVLLGKGVPLVVCNDDPAFWKAKALSYDWYIMFMAIASRDADLRLLKKLAQNSLMYSFLPDGEKVLAIRSWEKKWNKFIQDYYRHIGAARRRIKN